MYGFDVLLGSETFRRQARAEDGFGSRRALTAVALLLGLMGCATDDGIQGEFSIAADPASATETPFAGDNGVEPPGGAVGVSAEPTPAPAQPAEPAQPAFATAPAAPETTPEPSCPTWFRDCDGDGFAASDAGSVVACSAPAAQADCASWTQRAPAPESTDCNDASARHRPGADFALAVPGGNEGIQVLFCPPEGDGAGPTGYECVATPDADLDCDGRLEPDPAGAHFCLGGRCIAILDHACSGPSDCDCYEPDACGANDDASVRLCGLGEPATFEGSTVLRCR